MSKEHRAAFGPGAIPTVPYSHFTPVPHGAGDLWRVIGPTVARNIDRPLWTQFIAVYIEGLNHGAGVMREKYEATEPMPWLP